MNASTATGLSRRQAALIAGFGLLAMVATAPVAEFAIFPKLVIDGDIAATLANIEQNRRLFLYGVFCHFITFVADVFVAWALYYLFRPVSPAFSLLVAWFRLVYTVIAFVGLFNLFRAYDLATDPAYATALTPMQLQAQALILIDSFDQIWAAALILFGVHLALLGALIFKPISFPGLSASSLPRPVLPILSMVWRAISCRRLISAGCSSSC